MSNPDRVRGVVALFFLVASNSSSGQSTVNHTFTDDAVGHIHHVGTASLRPRELLICGASPRLISQGAMGTVDEANAEQAPFRRRSAADSGTVFTSQAVDKACVGGDPVSISAEYSDGAQPGNLAPKTLLIYYGFPSAINQSSNVEDASAVMAAYDYVVLAGGLEKETHPDHQNTVDIVGHPNMVRTTVFGYIELGVNTTNYSTEEIRTRERQVKLV